MRDVLLAVTGRLIDQAMRQEPCDHTLRHTRWVPNQWGEGQAWADAELANLVAGGGRCDCKVVELVDRLVPDVVPASPRG